MLKMSNNTIKMLALIALAVLFFNELGDDSPPGSRKKFSFKKFKRGLKRGLKAGKKIFKKGGKVFQTMAEKAGGIGTGMIKTGFNAVTGIAKEAIDTVKDPLNKAKEFYDIGKQTVVHGAKSASALAHGDFKRAMLEAENAAEPLTRKIGDEFTGGEVSKFEKKTGMKPAHFYENIKMASKPKNLKNIGEGFVAADKASKGGDGASRRLLAEYAY